MITERSVARTAYIDRGVIVGFKKGRVTSQINSEGRFDEGTLYEMHQATVAGDQPLAQQDWERYKKLQTIREKLGLDPLAIADKTGRSLREVINF